LLRGGVVVTCDRDHAVHAPGDVLLEDDRIGYVGPAFAGAHDRSIDLSGHLVMPGLINCHTHAAMTLFRTLADDVDLAVFLEDRVWPREVLLTPEDVYAGAMLGAVEMLKSGVTTYVDMYFWEEQLAQAALDAGIRALITPGILQAPAWEAILGSWQARLDRVMEFCKVWEGRGERVHTGLGPHAPYTLSLEALEAIAAAGRELDRLVHIHLVEAAWERQAFNEQGRGSTARVLDDIGFFRGKVLVAHSVWVDPGDVEIYARRGVGIAHCPQSNMKLGSGVAPVAQMLAHGVRVGLGTDGAATNNNLDMWEEMRLAPLLAKVTALDPKPVPARQALWMATRVAAKAVGLPEIGSLEVGRKADLITVSLEDTTAVPIFHPGNYVDHLVYSMDRSLVRNVWVNGRMIVDQGQVNTVDERAVREAAQEAAHRVSDRLAAARP
jgi:5-methylthioadenosine/S-adenosylhomocysteine deaminase